MRARKRETDLLEPCLQVLLGTLLGVKTDGIVARILPRATFPLRYLEVFLRFLNPLQRQRIHTSPSPSPSLRAGRSRSTPGGGGPPRGFAPAGQLGTGVPAGWKSPPPSPWAGR